MQDITKSDFPRDSDDYEQSVQRKMEDLDQLQKTLNGTLERNHIADTRNSCEERTLKLCKEDIMQTTTSAAVDFVYAQCSVYYGLI